MSVVWLVLSFTVPAQGQTSGHTMQDLEFMSGCWVGTFGNGGTMEEFYTAPSTNVMLGTTLYLRDGAAVQYEFTRIVMEAGAIVMTPYPRGKISEDPFTLTSVTATEAIFEAPEHDYPKRILYRTNDDGSRTARIDGGPEDPEPTEWILRKTSCDWER